MTDKARVSEANSTAALSSCGVGAGPPSATGVTALREVAA